MWIHNPFWCRGLALVLGLLVAGGLGGCRGGETAPDITTPIFFPPLPERPRLQFLTSLSGAEDLGAPGPSGFEKFVLGDVEQQEAIVTPYGLAIFDGRVYVCDVGRRRVVVLDLRSRSFGYLTDDRRLMNPVNIHITSDGTKYVADPTAGAVFVFDRSDTLQAILGKEAKISPIDVTVQGAYCYVTDFTSNQVVVLDRQTGQEVQRIGEQGDGEQQFKLISDLAFGPEGDLYVTDKVKARILEFDASGNAKRALGRLGDNIDELVRPKGVAVDRNGRIWVVDASTEVAKIYDAQGRLLLFFGLPGNEPGMMNLPAKIVLDYENVDLFERYAVRGARIDFLVLVSNQYGPNKVSVYGFGEFPVPTRSATVAPAAPRVEARAESQQPEVRMPVTPPAERRQPAAANETERMEAIAQVYYQSMAYYRGGRLLEARAGFVQVMESGLIPPAMRETLEGYIRDIDSRSRRDRSPRP